MFEEVCSKFAEGLGSPYCKDCYVHAEKGVGKKGGRQERW
jgi:hypothetical protein